MPETAADSARALAAQAEAVCRHYLSNGRREGRTWRVGDVDNTPGRSLCVQLNETGSRAAGRWIDFATGEHGDLLDLIARARRLDAFRDVLREARSFLSLPAPGWARHSAPPTPGGSPEAARRLFALARAIRGTLAETYLRGRGITHGTDRPALRFHPRCWYRAHDAAPREASPALLAAVTDLNGQITGLQRTWLAHDGSGKAPLATPRRALGQLAGHGVRLGVPTDVMAAGEGLETMLALRQVLPAMAMVAALSATHLAMLKLHRHVRRLYIARDNDRAGHRAADQLAARARRDGIEARLLTPAADDFNSDLCLLGHEALVVSVGGQLDAEDLARFVDGGSPVRPSAVSAPAAVSSASPAGRARPS